jgi:hypothetical protein
MQIRLPITRYLRHPTGTSLFDVLLEVLVGVCLIEGFHGRETSIDRLSPQ